jgi:hypothetical protein
VALELPPSGRPASGAPPLASWVALGVGVTALGVFTIFGAMAESEADSLRACEPRCNPNDADLRDAKEAGQRDAAVANTALVIGAAGLVTAGAIWLVDRLSSSSGASASSSASSTASSTEARPTPAPHLAVHPRGVTLTGAF